MTTDTITPTPEWMAKHRHQAAHEDQRTKTTCYRRVSLAQETLDRGDITREQFDAAERFHRIWHGSQGADVRTDFGGTPYDPDYPAQEAMSSDLAYARGKIRLKPMWDALEAFCVFETSLHDIGRQYASGKASRALARASGLTLVSIGLDLLADAWGISQQQRSRDRKAA